jgi:hypothetical protein
VDAGTDSFARFVLAQTTNTDAAAATASRQA